MPVRIIFRGLILFKVTEGENGVIVAKLVNSTQKPAARSADGYRMAGMRTEGRHAETHAHAIHQHDAEVQIFSRVLSGNGDEEKEEEKYEHVQLKEGDDRIEITFPDLATDFVHRAQSYNDYCPRLAAIMGDLVQSRSTASEPMEHTDADHKQSFVPHTVTVNRGTIRVKDVVSWDAGAFPLPRDSSEGVTIETPAEVKFVGSNVRGYMASECVVDVPHADWVRIGGRVVSLEQGDRHGGAKDEPSLHIPPRTAEILITNFPPQRVRALPWSAHFRWLFEAAGYRPVDIRGDDLKAFLDSARLYDEQALNEDMSLLLGPDGGFPFPYIEQLTPDIRLTPVNPVHLANDPWNRPVCPMGDE